MPSPVQACEKICRFSLYHHGLPDFVVRELEVAPRSSERYFFWTGKSKLHSAIGKWQRRLQKLFELANIESGYAHRFRDMFSTAHLLAGVPLDRVCVNELTGKASVFEQFGPPFFEQFQSIENLIAIIEAAQAEWQMPEAYLRGPVPEPTDPIAREFLSTLPIRRASPMPANEELLALLYWHNGDITRAVEHVRRYLELLPEDRRMKARLTGMMRPVM